MQKLLKFSIVSFIAIKTRGFTNLPIKQLFQQHQTLPHNRLIPLTARSRTPAPRQTRPEYTPKSSNQKQYVATLTNKTNHLVFALGPAGTGKTLFACIRAIRELQDQTIKKIVFTRPIFAVDEELGFLPGNINKKMDPWIRPIFDIFLEYYSQNEIDNMIQTGIIEIAPLAYMRGRTFKHCFIIADEMQNSSPNQMMMLTTRIGQGSRMIINGDLQQSDRENNRNGLAFFIDKYNKYNNIHKTPPEGIKICSLTQKDVERSAIVATVLKILDQDQPPTTEKQPSVYCVRKMNPDVSDISKEDNWEFVKKTSKHISTDDAAIIPIKDYKTNNKPLW